jgi:ABC-2 type transport system permease protein
MRKIWNLAWNDVLVEFSDRSTLLFFLVLPLVFTAILGLSLGDGTVDPGVDNRFGLLVVDLDQSEGSALLLDTLQSSEVVRPVLLGSTAAQQAFEERETSDVLLVLPAGFGQNLASGLSTELSLRRYADSNQALAIEQAVTSAIRRVESIYAAAFTSLAEAETRRPFANEPERLDYFSSGLTLAKQVVEDIPVGLEVVRPVESGSQIATGFEQSAPGQLVTWTLITLLAASEVFVSERVGGTLRRLLTTPTSRPVIIGGKITGRLGMGLLQMALLIGFGALLFNVDWGSSWPALILVCFTFGLAAVSLGVMIATFTKTRAQASGMTVLLGMVMAALGGAWWPLEITPPIYQAVVKLLPSTWAMMGFTDIMVRGQGLSSVLLEAGILIVFAVVFLVVGVRRLRFE